MIWQKHYNVPSIKGALAWTNWTSFTTWSAANMVWKHYTVITNLKLYPENIHLWREMMLNTLEWTWYNRCDNILYMTALGIHTYRMIELSLTIRFNNSQHKHLSLWTWMQRVFLIGYKIGKYPGNLRINDDILLCNSTDKITCLSTSLFIVFFNLGNTKFKIL